MTITADNKGGLKFWKFSERSLITRFHMPAEITKMELQRYELTPNFFFVTQL